MRFIFGFCAVFAVAVPAAADVPDYCAAYARDQADLGVKEKSIWQRRYDNALQTCGEQFSLQEPTAVVKRPKKPAVQFTPVKSKPVAKVKPTPELQAVASEKAAPLPNLTAGSEEWVAYCKKKYVSFNEAKGTYLSKTGIERKCLVTAD